MRGKWRSEIERVILILILFKRTFITKHNCLEDEFDQVIEEFNSASKSWSEANAKKAKIEDNLKKADNHLEYMIIEEREITKQTDEMNRYTADTQEELKM